MTAILLHVAALLGCASPPEPDEAAFFVVSDTHYFADEADPGRIDPRSSDLTARLIRTLNGLPGTEIPERLGGGRVRPPLGVLHTGDIIDTGDKGGSPVKRRMQETEWKAFEAEFGLTGKDGALQFPVYEGHGNHDGPRADTVVVRGIVERNKRRPGLSAVSPNGLHYSWDWGGVHFVHLGINAGRGEGATERRRYDPKDSLGFLAADLKEKVGDSGRPVVVLHHVHMYPYSRDPAAEAKGEEWDPADVRAYYELLKTTRVLMIVHGHTHASGWTRWDGTRDSRAPDGIRVLNVDSASHYKDREMGLMYVEILPRAVRILEYRTKDRWENGAWTSQWTFDR